jgi:endonuclease/exonuclease/phosphatase family metal-dependent hydrolase
VAGEVAGVLPARLPAASGASSGSLRVLQMNLCNSGEASCYTGGRSIDEAGALMRGAARPDLVTLNEVCRGDVTGRLSRVMADLWPYDDIVYLFAPALNAAGGPYRCQNGDGFGNGLLARVPAGQLTVLDTRYGLYAQQATDIERRTFGCVYLAPRYTACVTHLENLSPAVALAQCTTLMSGVIATLRGAWGAATPVLVAGDMNLAGGVSACVPADFRQVDDGVVQHVLGGAGIQFPRVDRYPMKQTDHDALLATATLS